MKDNTGKVQTYELRDVQYKIQNKNVTAVWLLLITQLLFCFMYGFFIKINEISIKTSQEFVHTALLLLFVIAGFGLVLAHSYKMVWSSLGFNLLIAAISIQMFFLVHAFWKKSVIYGGGSYFSTNYYYIALVPSEQGSALQGANLNEAIKCALSCIVAYTFIAGRTGILELYFVTITGTIVYELARETCLNNFPYQIGTIKIFLYGGVLGLVSSIVISRLGRQTNIIHHINKLSNSSTIILNIVGVIICWALFPLLTRDAYTNEITATQQVRVFSLVLAMSSAGLLSIFLGYTRYGYWIIIYSIIGAGVSVLSSTAYISNPVYGIVFGLASAIAQYIFLLIHEKLAEKYGQLDPHAYVFVGQGFLGIFFQAINRKAVLNPNSLLVFNWDSTSKAPQYILGNAAITIGMALLLGFAIGSIISCCVYHQVVDNYNDYTYWTAGDGLTKHHREELLYEDHKHQDYTEYNKDIYV